MQESFRMICGDQALKWQKECRFYVKTAQDQALTGATWVLRTPEKSDFIFCILYYKQLSIHLCIICV